MSRIEFTAKQALAWKILTDKTTTEIGYGGAGGGGKSFIGCTWLILACSQYPGINCCIGRKELVNLKRTTLMSFFEVVEVLGYKNDDLFTINFQTNTINFHNGSRIFLLDMAHQPSDPLYTRFGGLLLTLGFIDESNEIDQKAIDILKTRLGRWKNKEYDLAPKLLEAFNPQKNHVYQRFYKPSVEKNMPIYRYFIKALPTDNPYLSDEYILQLQRSDEITKQRLLYGNFEYDDDPTALCSYDSILDLFTNEHVIIGTKYLSADIAMMGRDLFVVFFWQGLRGKVVIVKEKSSGKEILSDIRALAAQYGVPISQIVCDSDGMGAYLEHFTDNDGKTHEGFLKHIKTFHGGSSPKKSEFKNLKSECAFKLAEAINKRDIYIECDDILIKNKIIQEIEQLKRDHVDKDEQKKSIITKEVMKENLGHSPDFLDCMIMRMVFELKGTRSYTIA